MPEVLRSHDPSILDNFDREINKIPDSFLPGLGENLDEVNRLLDPNNINRGHVPVVELPNVREGGFDLGDRANPWDYIFEAQRGPKPWPEGSHNQTIRRRIEELRSQGYTHIGGGNLTEEYIDTIGGKKSARRPDITMQRPDGSIYRENVGRTRESEDGSIVPIQREIDALDDIERATGERPSFTPYDRP